MAISVVGSARVLSSTTLSTNNITASSDFTVTGGADHVLVACATLTLISASADDAFSATAEGVSMLAAVRQCDDNTVSEGYGGIYYLVNPAAGATTIVLTHASLGHRSGLIHVIELAGVDAADPLGAIVGVDSSNHTTLSTNVTPEAAGNFVVSQIATRGSAAPFTPTGSAAELFDVETGTSTSTNAATWIGTYTTVGTSAVDLGADGDVATSGIFQAVEFRAGSSGAYTVTANAGSYAVTGQTVSLEYGREVAAAAGSYAVTGQSATLSKGLKVAAAAGAYAITGQDASLEFGRRVDALAGSYTITGAAASLEFGREITADAGLYAIAGADVTFSRSWAIGADAGSYAVTGSDTSLEFGREVAAGAGAYAIAGADATLAKGFTLGAEAGAYAVMGSDASLEFGYEVSAEAGAYTIVGAEATLLYEQVGAYSIIAEAGSYTITGADAGLSKGRSVIADAGAYDITGSDVTFAFGRAVQAEAGAYAIAGSEATLVYSGFVAEPAVSGGGGWSPVRRKKLYWTKERREEWERREEDRLRNILGTLPEDEVEAVGEVVEAIEVPPEVTKAAVRRVFEALVPDASLSDIVEAAARAYAERSWSIEQDDEDLLAVLQWR